MSPAEKEYQNPFTDQEKVTSEDHISKDDAFLSQDPLPSVLITHRPITLGSGINRAQIRKQSSCPERKGLFTLKIAELD